MELIKNNITINRSVKRGAMQKSVDTDLIVPDILADIVKILQVDGKAVILESKISDGKLIVSAKVNLNILYSPDRDDEKIQCIENSADFSFSVDSKDITQDMHANVLADVEKIDFQILNSRKLRIKTTVGITYEICEQAPFEFSSGIEDENAQVFITPFELVSLLDISEQCFSVREDFELPPGHTAIETILKTDVKICDAEQKIVSQRLVLRANLNFYCLYLDNTGCIKSADFEKPFTEIFDIENCDEDTLCDIRFCVKDISCHAEADSDGDMRILMLNTDVGVNITATKKIDTDILVDCFMPGKQTELVTKNTEIDKIVSCGTHQTTVRDIVAPPDSCPAFTGIYNVFTSPVIEKTDVLSDITSVTGHISCCILYISENADYPVYSLKKDIPFCLNIDTPKSKTGMNSTVEISPIHTSYNLNPASEVEIRCILSATAKISVKENICVIDDIEELESCDTSKKGIVLYFVQKNDTLWSISKNYNVAPKDILTVNNLDDDALLSVGKALLIPTI